MWGPHRSRYKDVIWRWAPRRNIVKSLDVSMLAAWEALANVESWEGYTYLVVCPSHKPPWEQENDDHSMAWLLRRCPVWRGRPWHEVQMTPLTTSLSRQWSFNKWHDSYDLQHSIRTFMWFCCPGTLWTGPGAKLKIYICRCSQMWSRCLDFVLEVGLYKAIIIKDNILKQNIRYYIKL